MFSLRVPLTALNFLDTVAGLCLLVYQLKLIRISWRVKTPPLRGSWLLKSSNAFQAL